LDFRDTEERERRSEVEGRRARGRAERDGNSVVEEIMEGKDRVKEKGSGVTEAVKGLMWSKGGKDDDEGNGAR